MSIRRKWRKIVMDLKFLIVLFDCNECSNKFVVKKGVVFSLVR
jgi:hypothetical protein